jgi:RecB family exonuclease
LQINSLGGGEILPGDSDDEAPLFVNAVARSWQVLYLSSRDADDGGAETTPSHFWQLSERLLRADEGCQVRRTLADQLYPATTAPTERHYRRAVAPRSQSGQQTIVGVPRDQRPWGRTVRALSNPQVLAGLQSRTSFSASEIEKYLDCPFAWFLQYCACIQEIDTQFDGRTYGKLAHDVLSATYRQLARTRKLPLTPQRVAEATFLASQKIDEAIGDEGCPGSFSEKRMAAWRLKGVTAALFQKESLEASQLVHIETELRVGGWDGVDIGGIRIRGRLDRVDSDRDRTVLFVVDYKTGSLPSRNSLGAAKGLQLPLYLAALSAERPKTRVIGGCYLSLVNGERSGVVAASDKDMLGAAAEGCRVLDEEQEQELREATLELARSAAESIRAGAIAPPAERNCPAWCEFGTVCRSRRGGYRP